MRAIQKGNTVRLKSGGPLMTVQEVGDYSIGAGITNGALCVWFDENKTMEKVFDLATLIVEDDY